MTARKPQAIAAEREIAAQELEGAIRTLGLAYRQYSTLTRELGSAIGHDLSGALDVPLCMHLADAGLSAFLERKLQGKAGALRDVVAQAHRKLIKSENQT